MGGGQQQQEPLYPTDKIQLNDLVDRSPQQTDTATASDDYTQNAFKKRKAQSDKESNALMDALARLGMVNEAMPRGFVPNPPYRLPEQQIGF
jgi:hypothetical protein